MEPVEKIGVLGAGSWGTALARLLAKKGHSVTIWAREPEVVAEINADKRNSLFLKGIDLPSNLMATHNMKGAILGQSVIVSVIPSHASRSVFAEIEKIGLTADQIFVSCSKGIEIETGKLISDIIAESLPTLTPKNRVYLSGPTFAREVAMDLPSTAVIAGEDASTTKRIQDLFRTNRFLTFTHDDVIGVEVGGAVKNVIAIACGLSDGLGFGYNTRAALITRGLYEMIKIGKKLGASPLTFSGLTGIGDLVLTCTGELSRNRTVGMQIGKGEKIDDILSGMTMVAEGVKTAKAIYNLSKKLCISTPISNEVYFILHEGKSPHLAVQDLTTATLTDELKGIVD